jgi:1,4-dihydroxy-2-naphthoate octaprenyltransferase
MSLKNWLIAIRPKTLTAIVVPVFLGGLYSYPKYKINLFSWTTILCFGINIQILTNLVNDLFDYRKGSDTKARIGPIRVTQAGLISQKKICIAIIFLTIISLILGLYLIKLGGINLIYLVLASIIFAFAYTAGPFPLAYLGLGEIFVFIFFGPIACGFTFYLLNEKYLIDTFILGMAPGLISSAILVANNIRDHVEDKNSKKKTLVVRFGPNFGKSEYCIFLVLASLIPIILAFYLNKMILILPAFYILFAYFPLKIIFSKNTNNIPLVLAQTSFLLIIFTLLFSLSWLIMNTI